MGDESREPSRAGSGSTTQSPAGAQLALKEGDCLSGGSPKGDYQEFYLLADLTRVPCAAPHRHEIYAPGFTVGGIGPGTPLGERCPAPGGYSGWTERTIWTKRVAGQTIVSALETTGSPIEVFCSLAVVDYPAAGGLIAVETRGSFRDVASDPEAVAKYGACITTVPEVGQGSLIVPCDAGRSLWLQGTVFLGVDDERYPGAAEVLRRALSQCLPHVEALTGGRDRATYEIRLPSVESWDAGRSEAGCHVWYDATSSRLDG